MDSAWEDHALHEEAGRPRRRCYRITHDGAEQARETPSRAYRSRKRPLPGWAVARPGS
ncbi:hypothetical protein [Streptomyces sp. NPDC048191]|uniref:hypothetical protein n=1 Tax=Streptomyces sp. NPDC048191 TaxID=3155484 RepID=UPI0033C4C9DE